MRVNKRVWQSLPDNAKYWCGVFIHEAISQGKNAIVVRTAAAAGFIAAGKIWTMQDVAMGRYVPKSGDLRIKKRHGGNHVDIVWSWDNDKGILIGGNVSNSVKARPASIQSMIADKTTYIIEVNGYYGY